MLSGNRNFEGRIQQQVRANYLASPPLVVAYALAGRMTIDLTTEPIGKDLDGKDVFLREIWPTEREIQTAMLGAVKSEMFQSQYAERLRRRRALAVAARADGRAVRVGSSSRHTSASRRSSKTSAASRRRSRHYRRPRACRAWRQRDDRSHLSRRIDPGGQSGWEVSHRAGRQAERLQFVRRAARQSRSHGARDVREYPAAQSDGAGTEGGWTMYQPGGELMTHLRRVDCVSGRGRAAAGARGQGIRVGLLARLGGERDAAARRARGHRRELRAHSSQQSGEHGRAAAPVQPGESAASLGLTGRESYRHRDCADLTPRSDHRRARAARSDGTRTRNSGCGAHRHAGRADSFPARRDTSLRPAATSGQDDLTAQ